MSGWIGVDFDGTLAQYGGWVDATHCGEPIQPMVDRVKAWLAEGREVRIMTARIFPYTRVLQPNEPMAVPEGDRGKQAFAAACAIAQWCRQHIGQVLPITCVKDYGMVELWDDRAVQVRPNTGARADARPVPLSEDQIMELARGEFRDPRWPSTAIDIARAVERAHNIT